jgi:hypothetical protein
MTEKQEAFITAYLGPARLNATKAARIAGYAWPDKQGSVVARHPDVKPILDREVERWAAAATRALPKPLNLGRDFAALWRRLDRKARKDAARAKHRAEWHAARAAEKP